MQERFKIDFFATAFINEELSSQFIESTQLTNGFLHDESSSAGQISGFRSKATITPTPEECRSFVRAIESRIYELQINSPSVRGLKIDLSKYSRVGACILLLTAANACYFRKYEILYQEDKYSVGGKDLLEMSAEEEFWQTVYNHPSKFVALPYAGGTYDASKERAVFVCGGIDFGRAFYNVTRWEPKNVVIVVPEVMKGKLDRFIVEELAKDIETAIPVGRTDYAKLLDALDEWAPARTLESNIQPLLVLAGWKMHAVLACFWAIEHENVPLLALAPEFVTDKVSSISGQLWCMHLTDRSVIA